MYYVDQKRQSISFYTMHNFLLTRPLLIFLFLLFRSSSSSSLFPPPSTPPRFYIYIYIFFHPHIHRHHIDPRINFLFNTASWIVELYTITTTFLFSATITTTTTFLSIVSLHNHHHHHIPTVFTSPTIFLADRLFRRTDRPKAVQKGQKSQTQITCRLEK